MPPARRAPRPPAPYRCPGWDLRRHVNQVSRGGGCLAPGLGGGVVGHTVGVTSAVAVVDAEEGASSPVCLLSAVATSGRTLSDAFPASIAVATGAVPVSLLTGHIAWDNSHVAGCVAVHALCHVIC